MAARQTVLVIEDDADLREMVADLLESEGYEFVLCADGEEAFARLYAGLWPRMILLDLMMPKMDGWQFMEQLRAVPAFAGIPVVVLSAYGTPEGVRSLGAADYLRKPFDPDALLAAVARYCSKAEPGGASGR
jgi:two-component system, chemotaxis family, chemotaxis protein CheY